MRGGRPLTLPQGVLPQNWGGTEQNRTVTCMVLKATANDRQLIAARRAGGESIRFLKVFTGTLSHTDCSAVAILCKFRGKVPWREQTDRDGSTNSRLGLGQGSLLAREEWLTHPGALITTHVHCQLYNTSHCPAGRCHHPEENQYDYRGGHGSQ
ncbi:hypothetical protein TNCV_3132331 [Trichonephila clavipes]|nr:hypothetical protein TNCV_3132331 [Trichonephila clavipes]